MEYQIVEMEVTSQTVMKHALVIFAILINAYQVKKKEKKGE
jgi:hypothetical protein